MTSEFYHGWLLSLHRFTFCVCMKLLLYRVLLLSALLIKTPTDSVLLFCISDHFPYISLSKSRIFIENIMELFLLEKHPIPKGVNIPNFETMAAASNFTTYELKRLFCRFCLLCGENGNTNGRVEKFTFLQQPELSFCYLAEFAYEYEQGKTKAKVGRGETWPKGLDFSQFVSVFSEFSPLNPGHKKAECKYSDEDLWSLHLVATVLC